MGLRQILNRYLCRVHPFAHFFAQNAEVGLGNDRYKRCFIRLEFYVLHIKLVSNQMLLSAQRLQYLRICRNNVSLGKRLTHFDLMFLAESMTKAHHFLRVAHLLLKGFIPLYFFIGRKIAKMDGFWSILVLELKINRIANERNKRSRDFCQRQKDRVKCLKSFSAILRRFFRPKSRSETSDIPIRQLIDETDKGFHSAIELIVVHPLIYIFYQFLEQRQDPAIDFCFRSSEGFTFRLPVVNFCVGG